MMSNVILTFLPYPSHRFTKMYKIGLFIIEIIRVNVQKLNIYQLLAESDAPAKSFYNARLTVMNVRIQNQLILVRVAKAVYIHNINA